MKELYQELSKIRLQLIISILGQSFFKNKKVVDFGCGDGDMVGSLHRLCASVTAIDARQKFLIDLNKKFKTLKTLNLNLETKYEKIKDIDIAISVDVLSHLVNYQDHLIDLCDNSKVLLLESAVADSNDENYSEIVPENKNNEYYSYTGNGSSFSELKVERILKSQGMSFIRLDTRSLNYRNFVYDWKYLGTGRKSLRRFWIASKSKQTIESIKSKCISNKINYKLYFSGDLEINQVTPQIPKHTEKFDQINRYNIFNRFTKNNQVNNLTTPSPQIKKEEKINNLNKKFVIIVPSYKNESWAEKNILSALNQNYDNFRIIFTDDCSPDNTFSIVEKVVNNHKNKDKCTLIKNNVRKGALENIYDMTHSCDDEEIIVTLDGDDWLANNDVLNVLNKEYSSNDIWMTYGQFESFPNVGMNCRAIPDEVVRSSSFRSYPFCASHLRTFYSWLFKRIKKEDLLYEGKFMPMAWDVAFTTPMLEMCGYRFKLIQTVLYVYNTSNPISDYKVNEPLQKKIEKFVRLKPKYNLLLEKPQDIEVVSETINYYVNSNKSLYDKKFAIVIPSYNNQEWAEKNILSALNQNYDNFRIIFTDDCSTDNTFSIVEKVLNNHKNKDKCTLIKNNVRKGALENLYDMIHSCQDDEIIATLDGDDWLADNEVLNTLNNVYLSDDIWMTYGRHQNYPGSQIGSAPIPEDVIKTNSFRNYTFCASHLRTFYSRLFKKIKKEDLLYEGKFMSMAWDVAMMIPMLEMSGHKFKFIDKVLYMYNVSNPISDFRVDQALQLDLEKFVKNKKKYDKLDNLFSIKLVEYYNDNMIFISVEDQ